MSPQASFLVVGGNDGEPAAGVEQRVRDERRVRGERRVHEGSEHTGFSLDNASFEYIRFCGSSLTWRR